LLAPSSEWWWWTTVRAGRLNEQQIEVGVGMQEEREELWKLGAAGRRSYGCGV
jgi:hypothetical protein